MARNSTVAQTPDESDWRVESDLSTLIECEKIEKDPKRMAKVRALAKKKMLDFAAVATEGE